MKRKEGRREIIDGLVEKGTKREVEKRRGKEVDGEVEIGRERKRGERRGKVVYRKGEFKSVGEIKESERERKMIYRMRKRMAKFKRGERRREIIDWLVKVIF